MKKKIVLVLIIIIALIFIGDIYISKNKQENDQETETTNNVEENTSLEDANQVELENTTNTTNQEEQNKTSNNNQNNQNKQSEQVVTEKKVENEDLKIEKQVAPRGFMGSSAYKVNLYSNGDVYIITYDGNGYEDNNIISKDIIAKKAQDIEVAEDEEQEGAVIVKGGEVINNKFGWISFSK
mgnify:CR=1 FL=1